LPQIKRVAAVVDRQRLKPFRTEDPAIRPIPFPQRVPRERFVGMQRGDNLVVVFCAGIEPARLPRPKIFECPAVPPERHHPRSAAFRRAVANADVRPRGFGSNVANLELCNLARP
jgi:hypothetical protein